MNGKRAIIGATLFTALAFGLLMAQDRPKDTPGGGALGGKYLSYLPKTQSSGTTPPLLEGADVRQIGDRWYLTGRVVEDSSGYRKGMKLWVPLEEVGHMVAFDDLGDWRAPGRKVETTTGRPEIIRSPATEIKAKPYTKVETVEMKVHSAPKSK